MNSGRHADHADAFAAVVGAHRERNPSRFPVEHPLALVWERMVLPAALSRALDSIPEIARVGRVCLLPAGMDNPSPYFSFMEGWIGQFARDGADAVRTMDRRTLWVAGQFPEEDEFQDMSGTEHDGNSLLGVVAWVPSPQDELAAIHVWRQEHTPEQWAGLVNYGGDEDWVAHVPHSLPEFPLWLDEGGSFGCCSVGESEVADGVLYTGCHA